MKYNTRQQSIIDEYLKNNDEKHLTMKEIYDGLKDKNISLATLYRHLDALVKEGKVRKYIYDNNKEACFQYIDETCSKHFHLICNRCHKLIHLECDEVEKLLVHISSEHSFKVDESKIIIYGLCKQCQEELNND